MIPDNELRKGNYFIDPADGKIEKVLALSYEMIKVLDKNAVSYKDALPISLTPEILENCGAIGLPKWNLFGESAIIVNKETCITYTSTGIIGVAIVNNHEGELIQRTVSFLNHIKYLHQLQNLIVCLAGEEMGLKQPL